MSRGLHFRENVKTCFGKLTYRIFPSRMPVQLALVVSLNVQRNRGKTTSVAVAEPLKTRGDNCVDFMATPRAEKLSPDQHLSGIRWVIWG